VYKPLRIEDFIDQEVQTLSGGELQRVAITLALGTPADVYVIVRPSTVRNNANIRRTSRAPTSTRSSA
jgi:translation initiation factor RLI1